eukprot:SAG22_NODE_955_length_6331_cov_21.329108_9_plen_226_part_00
MLCSAALRSVGRSVPGLLSGAATAVITCPIDVVNTHLKAGLMEKQVRPASPGLPPNPHPTRAGRKPALRARPRPLTAAAPFARFVMDRAGSSGLDPLNRQPNRKRERLAGVVPRGPAAGGLDRDWRRGLLAAPWLPEGLHPGQLTGRLSSVQGLGRAGQARASARACVRACVCVRQHVRETAPGLPPSCVCSYPAALAGHHHQTVLSADVPTPRPPRSTLPHQPS